MTNDDLWRRPASSGPAEDEPTLPAVPIVDVGDQQDAAADSFALDAAPITTELPPVDDPTPVHGTPVITRAALRKRPWMKWLVRTLFVVGGLVLVAFVYYAVTLYQVWSTGRSDQSRAVDAIVVMGAAQYDGRPSPLLQARLDHALELFDADLAPVIVVTGGKQSGDRFTEAAASRRYLRNKGVPNSKILSEEKGRSTWQSLAGVSALLDKRRGDESGRPRVLIVTDPFHSLRARLIAQELDLTAYVSPARTSPWGGGTQFRKSIKEAAGIAVGRIIGFRRLWSVTG